MLSLWYGGGEETFWRRQSFSGDVLAKRERKVSQPLMAGSPTANVPPYSRIWTITPATISFVCLLLITIEFKFVIVWFCLHFGFFKNTSFGCIIQCDNETGRRNFLQGNGQTIRNRLAHLFLSLSLSYQQQWGANTAAAGFFYMCLSVRIYETDPVFRWRRLSSITTWHN